MGEGGSEPGWLYDVSPAVKGGGCEGFDQNWLELSVMNKQPGGEV